MEYYIGQKAGNDPARVDENLRLRLRGEFIQLQVAARIGERMPGIARQAELARLEFLARAGAKSAGIYTPPTEQELEQEYAAYRSAQPGTEYHAAHILVSTASAAEGTLRRLANGESFATVAGEESADESKAAGGDIGWVHAGHLPPEFMNALASLHPGEVMQTPVKTIYGWHVIKLIDARTASVPSLDQLRSQLAADLEQKRFTRFLDDAARQMPDAATLIHPSQ